MSKVVIFGAGMVGSTTAYALVVHGTASEIVLIDINRRKAEGEALDLSHCAAFVRPVKVYSGSYEDCHDAQIIIITAGVNQKPGERRIDLIKKNAGIIEEITPHILNFTREAILIIVTNPVDILTYIALKISGLPSSQVIGSGTVLDTSRFRHLISKHCGVDPRNVHAYVVGEHGDTEVPVWSTASIGGIPIDNFCKVCSHQCTKGWKENINNMVRDAAYEIIERKGSTYYAIALALNRITESILRNENSVLTVSSYVHNLYGIDDICLSLPCIVNNQGIKQVLHLSLSDSEIQALQNSASTIKKIYQDFYSTALS